MSGEGAIVVGGREVGRKGSSCAYLACRVKDLDNREESAHQLRSMKRKRRFFSKKVRIKGEKG